MPETSSKVALITGASSGLGLEFARQLAIMNFDLILVARREDRLDQLAKSLRSIHQVKVTIVAADLSTLSGIEKVVETIKSTPDLDFLVNNAGFGILRRFLQGDPGKELSLLQVHMIAPVMLCRAALPEMIVRNRGSIINVSSLAGIIPIRSVLYGSSKSFIISFSESLQEELQNTAIRIQALCPGFIHTEFHDSLEFSRFNRQSIPDFLWLSPEQVVSESIQSLQRMSVICIPGRFYGFIGMLARNSVTAGLIKITARFVLRRRKR